VLGIEGVPAEASSRFTKPQDQREAMPGRPPSRRSWRPVRCRRCSPWRLLRLGHVSTARAVAERQRHRQPRLAVYFSQSTGLDGPRVRPSVTSQVLTNRVGGSISTYVPRHEHWLPPGVTKTVWKFPPTRRSISRVVTVSPPVAHHGLRCSGLVKTSKTSPLKASKIYVVTISSSLGSVRTAIRGR